MQPSMQVVGELASWRVTLVDGTVLEVAAHGYSGEADMYVFSILMVGEPNFEVDVLRLPRASVRRVRGG